MNWNFAKYAAIGSVVVAGVLSVVRTFGQTQPANPKVYRQQQGMDPSRTPPYFGPGMPNRQLPGHESMSPNHEMQEKVRQALSKMRASDSSDDEKKEAKETIQTILKEIFQRDQKKRRDQIKNMEEQISRLKKQLEKRESAEEKLIDLQLQLLENDGDGLSFPNAWNELWAPQPNGIPGFFPPGNMPGEMHPNAASNDDRSGYFYPPPQQPYSSPYPAPQYPNPQYLPLPVQPPGSFQMPGSTNDFPRPVQIIPLWKEPEARVPSEKSIPKE